MGLFEVFQYHGPNIKEENSFCFYGFYPLLSIELLRAEVITVTPHKTKNRILIGLHESWVQAEQHKPFKQSFLNELDAQAAKSFVRFIMEKAVEISCQNFVILLKVL